MKKLTLIIASLAILSFLFSCSNDDDNSKNDPPTTTYNAKLKLSARLNYSSYLHQIGEEIISEVDYNMGNIASLIYVVHNADNGAFVKFINIDKSSIPTVDQNKFTIIEDSELPFGNYYISLIVTTDNKLSNKLLAKGLMHEYSKAACQIPNNHIYYSTIKVSCMPPNGQSVESVKENIEFSAETILKQITGEFIVLLPEGSKKIPEDAKFSITTEIVNLPSAFFIKDGTTLSNEEVKELGLYKYNKKVELTERYDSQLTAKYFLLGNNHLNATPEERGYFTLTYKENTDSEDITKLIEIDIPECRQEEYYTTSDFIYIYDLYSNKSKKEIMPKRSKLDI